MRINNSPKLLNALRMYRDKFGDGLLTNEPSPEFLDFMKTYLNPPGIRTFFILIENSSPSYVLYSYWAVNVALSGVPRLTRINPQAL